MKPFATDVNWEEAAAGLPRPTLQVDLAGWQIDRKRPARWNARRREGGVVYHLKWFFHGLPTNPARAEWRGAHLLATHGIAAVTPLGWGRHPSGTFVVLLDAPGFPVAEWRARGLSVDVLTRVAIRAGRLVARLHDARLCHRDLNVYHVFVDSEQPRLIDVGRVARFRRRRWIVKDLASLLDTARFESIPMVSWRAFFRSYLQATRRRWNRRRLLRRVERKAQRYRRHNRKHDR